MRFALAWRTEPLSVILRQNSLFMQKLLSTLGMERGWGRSSDWSRTCKVEIHYDRVLTTSDDDSFTGLFGASVNLLVRCKQYPAETGIEGYSSRISL
jgi:hypothetical protein